MDFDLMPRYVKIKVGDQMIEITMTTRELEQLKLKDTVIAKMLSRETNITMGDGKTKVEYTENYLSRDIGNYSFEKNRFYASVVLNYLLEIKHALKPLQTRNTLVLNTYTDEQLKTLSDEASFFELQALVDKVDKELRKRSQSNQGDENAIVKSVAEGQQITNLIDFRNLQMLGEVAKKYNMTGQELRAEVKEFQKKLNKIVKLETLLEHGQVDLKSNTITITGFAPLGDFLGTFQQEQLSRISQTKLCQLDHADGCHYLDFAHQSTFLAMVVRFY